MPDDWPPPVALLRYYCRYAIVYAAALLIDDAPFFSYFRRLIESERARCHAAIPSAAFDFRFTLLRCCLMRRRCRFSRHTRHFSA